MKKNVASQNVGAQVISATTGAPITSGVSVQVSGDGGAFASSSGTLTHLGNGWWNYAPTQAETNYTFVAFQFTASGAVPETAAAYTEYPQSGDVYAALPTNFSSLEIDGSGRIDLGKILGTASAGAAGYIGPDWSKINAPTTTVDLSGTTIDSVSGSVGSVTGAVGSVTGNLGGNVVGSVGSVSSPVAVTSNIKKNSTSRLSFTMTDSTNHAPDPGLTVAGQVSIDGAGFVSLTNSVIAIADGDYTVALAAADTNGDTLIFRFTATGADDLNIMVFTQP